MPQSPSSDVEVGLESFPPPDTTKFPIVLCHGVCRFDFALAKVIDNHSSELADKFHYFRGIRSCLIAKGFRVFHSAVPWSAGVEKRSEVLYENIQEVLDSTGSSKVNLICHSMGGLDARHMLFNHRHEHFHTKIASLTTLSTPHEGSTFADYCLKNITSFFLVLEKLGLDTEALQDLTTDQCIMWAHQPEVIQFERKCFRYTYTLRLLEELRLFDQHILS
ncbi:hypothetical protein GEMRC1_011744 [Eukaryota sp. GEM-RC1]